MESAAKVLSPQQPTRPAAHPSCPWATSVTVHTEPISLSEVMSEQLAMSLHLEEPSPTNETSPDTSTNFGDVLQSDPPDLLEDPQCKNDLLLAQILQAEYDREHDAQLAREERKYNGTSKVKISFNKFRKAPDNFYLDDDNGNEEDKADDRDWDLFETDEKNFPVIGKGGVCREGKTVVATKHDLDICGRRNACKVMSFPPSIQTGDGGGFDMSLNNKVYNSLRVHTVSEEKKRFQRSHDKKEKLTNDLAVDVNTKLLLYKLLSGGVLNDITGTISTGKEAHVYHAFGGPGQEASDEDDNASSSQSPIPENCAIKVFKTTLAEFKNRSQYIEEDYRFKGRMKALSKRKYIHLWAEKEMHNLNRLNKAGIPCPEVVSLKKHVLVMSFVGSGCQPAPKLKEARLSKDDKKAAYEQTIEAIKTMYKQCRLVHADLSEYNLLWHEGKVWVIDLAQAVDLSHPNCLEFLYRDCVNMSNFFAKQGVAATLRPKPLFVQVTSLDFPGEEGPEFLSQIRNYEREKAELASSNYSRNHRNRRPCIIPSGLP